MSVEKRIWYRVVHRTFGGIVVVVWWWVVSRGDGIEPVSAFRLSVVQVAEDVGKAVTTEWTARLLTLLSRRTSSTVPRHVGRGRGNGVW